MTTPARNTSTSAFVSVGYSRTRYNSAGTVTQKITGTHNEVPVIGRQIRPESGSSPVRADKSRAPRAWSHSWGEVTAWPRKVVFTRPYGSGGKEEIMVDGVGIHPFQNVNIVGVPNTFFSSTASLVGFGWCASGNNGYPLNADALAITKLRQEILDGKAQWGTTLGELRKTAGGVASLCGDVVDVLDSLTGIAQRLSKLRKEEAKKFVLDTLRRKSGKKRKKRPRPPGAAERQRLRTENAILNRWLEFQFSVKPTLMDIQQSGEAISWLIFEENLALRVKFKAGGTDISRERLSYQSNWFSGHSVQCTATVTVDRQVHYSVLCDIEQTPERTFQQLGLTNVGLVAWELCQFSWMVDYVLGIGDWLNSMVKLDGVKFVEGTKTVVGRIKFDTDELMHLNPKTSGASIQPSRVPLQGEFGRMQRTVLGAIPGPSLFPPVRSRLGLNQMANSLAALAKVAQSAFRN